MANLYAYVDPCKLLVMTPLFLQSPVSRVPYSNEIDVHDLYDQSKAV